MYIYICAPSDCPLVSLSLSLSLYLFLSLSLYIYIYSYSVGCHYFTSWVCGKPDAIELGECSISVIKLLYNNK